jgi:hypothetical protein
MYAVQKQEEQQLGQLEEAKAGYLARQLQPGIESAAKQLRAAMDKQRKGFWLGMMAATAIILGMHYIMKESQE